MCSTIVSSFFFHLCSPRKSLFELPAMCSSSARLVNVRLFGAYHVSEGWML